MASPLPLIFSLLALSLHLQLSPGEAVTFTITNNCDYTVWPGILSNAGVAPLSTTGFALQKGETRTVNPPSGWGGRFWGRTFCSTDQKTGKFTCLTGDCGSGKIDCSGAGALPPATLAEFTLEGADGMDFYDVSLVDGYNIAMLVAPRGGGGPNCSYTGCINDLNGACPSDLKVMSAGEESAVACKSACDAFNTPQYCCSGAYGSPDTCKPSSYSLAFKKACPRAYSYAYDDKSSTFTCKGSPDYTITFCPSPATSQKASSSDEGTPSTSTPSSDVIMNSSMVYEGALDMSSSPSKCNHSPLIAGGVATFIAIWRLSELFF
ncbi:thaumatin-like protein 1b [Chenopodium quinoa]|uniref:thaumatin-like protein 1b n=1 Tax=Chenopodium quinoa TaxID=63459 RepID=UPI000B79062D|nr:thaumatin-like protein 1b [Chenopodium quinoa]